MVTVLTDENCVGQAVTVFRALTARGYVDLLDIRLRRFEEVGLVEGTDDETVWRFCQEQGYYLLSGNRRTVDGLISLELVTQRLATDDCLPILTIGDMSRVSHDRIYCYKCAESIGLVALEPERFRGIPRLYIPLSSVL